MKTKYPYQIDSIVHKSKDVYRTFGMDAKLFSPPEESEDREPSAPLEMHEGYSLFKGTLIAKEGTDRKFVTFNIPAKDVPYIHKKTTMVMELALDKKLNPKKTEKKTGIGTGTGPAYTVKIPSGTLKGKTPAQVLSSPSGQEALENHKKWLEDNLVKFKNNQVQIDAINEAIELYKSEKLIMDIDIENSADEIIEIYSCPSKNIQPKDERGYWTVYDVSITYDPAKNMPYEIKVNNCFAPVDKSKGNEIVMSKADKKKRLSMSLSESEWFSMIDTMKAQKIMFESLTYPEQLKIANKINEENRKKSKAV